MAIESYSSNLLPICVAIQVKSIEQALADAGAAIVRKARFIEYRLDYCKKPAIFTLNTLRQLVQSTVVPVVLTMRRQEEGGQLKITEQKRLNILRMCIEAKPAFVDIEASLEVGILAELYSIANVEGVGIIYSYHDFQKTPPPGEIQKILDKLIAKCPGIEPGPRKRNRQASILTQGPIYILKMVFTAQAEEDNKAVLEICSVAHQIGINYICFAMGDFGIPSRVWSIQTGAFFSFASTSEATAPGQVTIEKFYEIHAQMNIEKKI